MYRFAIERRDAANAELEQLGVGFSLIES
jgi:hypothetical protein